MGRASPPGTVNQPPALILRLPACLGHDVIPIELGVGGEGGRSRRLAAAGGPEWTAPLAARPPVHPRPAGAGWGCSVWGPALAAGPRTSPGSMAPLGWVLGHHCQGRLDLSWWLLVWTWPPCPPVPASSQMHLNLQFRIWTVDLAGLQWAITFIKTVLLLDMECLHVCNVDFFLTFKSTLRCFHIAVRL